MGGNGGAQKATFGAFGQAFLSPQSSPCIHSNGDVWICLLVVSLVMVQQRIYKSGVLSVVHSEWCNVLSAVLRACATANASSTALGRFYACTAIRQFHCQIILADVVHMIARAGSSHFGGAALGRVGQPCVAPRGEACTHQPPQPHASAPYLEAAWGCGS